MTISAARKLSSRALVLKLSAAYNIPVSAFRTMSHRALVLSFVASIANV